MKSIRDYLAQDWWGHCLMSADAIRGCATGETCKTAADKLEYSKGIMTVFPHMLLANFSRWFWDGQPPKDYGKFMDASVAALQAEVFPILEKYFDETNGMTDRERGALLAPILTDLIPKHVLSGYYDYYFAGTADYKDLSTFWPMVAPLLNLTANAIAMVYSADEVDIDEKGELFVYIGARMPFIIIKRWYEWEFGKEKMEMPPPPPQD